MALLVARGASCHGLQELHRIATSLLGLGIEGDVARRFERNRLRMGGALPLRFSFSLLLVLQHSRQSVSDFLILLRIEVRKILQKGLHVIFILGLSAVMRWIRRSLQGHSRHLIASIGLIILRPICLGGGKEVVRSATAFSQRARLRLFIPEQDARVPESRGAPPRAHPK